MVACSDSNISSAPAPPFANRFQLLEGLPDDGEITKPPSKFQAQGVYKPPHMRTPSESVEPITGSDPTASSTSAIRPAHGPSLDHERKGTSRPHTPHNDSAPGSAIFGFGEMKKKIYEELLNARKAMEEMEMIEKELLKEEERFEEQMEALRNAGLTNKEIRDIMNRGFAGIPSRPPSVKPLDLKSVDIDLARISLGPGKEVEQFERPAKTHEERPVQQTEEELVNKTPTPGGPMYLGNHPRGMCQTGKYGHSTPSVTPASGTHRDAFVCQATGQNDQVQVYPGVTDRHGPVSFGTFQVPGQIYQTNPGMMFNSSVDSLPPRFRQPLVYHQLAPLHYQTVVQNGPRDTLPVGHPALRPPVLSQPQNSTSNHTFRSTSMPPPPRPYLYRVDSTFDFEGVALSSNCNRDIFVQIYCRMNGVSPSQAAWVAWTGAVERVKRIRQHEYKKTMERETKERFGVGSRLPKWCSNLTEDLPGSESGYSSSLSDASTKVASSRTSEASDEGSMVVGVVKKWEPGVPRAQKRWKDVTDKTWAFGEPPRPDDPWHYMTHIVEKMGWQVHNPRPE